jgi:hypothetical protein
LWQECARTLWLGRSGHRIRAVFQATSSRCLCSQQDTRRLPTLGMVGRSGSSLPCRQCRLDRLRRVRHRSVRRDSSRRG